MCDYSLCGLPNRLAVEGEELKLHRFATGSMGMVSPRELSEAANKNLIGTGPGLWNRIRRAFDSRPLRFLTPRPREVVVCMPPGADLLLKGIPVRLQQRYKIGETEAVTFIQTTAAINTYRDAVQFRNGRIVSLQDLPSGARVEVLSMSRVHAEDADMLLERAAVMADVPVHE